MSSKEANEIAGDKIAALEFLGTIPKRLIESFWSQIEIKQTGNCNEDYGEHFCILSFPSDSVKKRSLKEANNVRTNSKDRVKSWIANIETLSNNQPTLHDGSGTFGLVTDKCNFVQKWKDPPKTMTVMQKHFLDDLRSALITLRHEVGKKNSECLRIKVVKGAFTVPHTDTLRCTLLSNYFIFFPPLQNLKWERNELEFSIKLQLWPTFKTSFVLFRDQVCIPFQFKGCPLKHTEFQYHSVLGEKGGFLKLIKFCETTKKAKWLVTPPACLHELLPLRKMKKGIAVAGLGDGELYLLRGKYKVFTSWNQVEKIGFNDLLNNCTVKDNGKKRTQFRTMDKSGHLYRFKGWELIHWVEQPISDPRAIRLHVFFQNVRPVGVCAQASVKRGSSTSIEVIQK